MESFTLGLMRGDGAPLYRCLLYTSGHVTMTVLPPIETAGLDRAAQKALPDEVARRIAAHKDKTLSLIHISPM